MFLGAEQSEFTQVGEMPKKAYISFQIQVTKDTTTCLEQWQT